MKIFKKSIYLFLTTCLVTPFIFAADVGVQTNNQDDDDSRLGFNFYGSALLPLYDGSISNCIAAPTGYNGGGALMYNPFSGFGIGFGVTYVSQAHVQSLASFATGIDNGRLQAASGQVLDLDKSLLSVNVSNVIPTVFISLGMPVTENLSLGLCFEGSYVAYGTIDAPIGAKAVTKLIANGQDVANASITYEVKEYKNDAAKNTWGGSLSGAAAFRFQYITDSGLYIGVRFGATYMRYVSSQDNALSITRTDARFNNASTTLTKNVSFPGGISPYASLDLSFKF